MKKLPIAVAVSVLSFGAVAARPAAADPPSNGCPTGNRASDVDHGILLLSVADLTASGHHVPALIDDPANGGNGDGFVCGIPIGNQTTPSGDQLYGFSDNQFSPGP